MLETIFDCHQQRLALVIRSGFGDQPANFATQNSDSLQVGTIVRKKGERIPSHRHHPVDIQVSGPKQEFIYVIEGAVTVTFYDETDQKVAEKILHPGEAMLQISGGHGFEFHKDTRMIEVKQGPYINQQIDKTLI